MIIKTFYEEKRIYWAGLAGIYFLSPLNGLDVWIKLDPTYESVESALKQKVRLEYITELEIWYK